MKSQIDGDKDIQGTALAGFYETENPASHVPALSDSKSAGNLLAVFAFTQVTFTHVVVKGYVNAMEEQQMILTVLLHPIQ